MKAVAFIFAALFVTAAQTRPVFDVASVKPTNIIKGPGQLRYTPAGVDFSNVSVASIIGEAYGIPNSRISSPDAHNRELLDSRTVFFDVSARAATEVPQEQIKMMLQTLLSDRFKLVLHRDSKNESVYKLVVAKGGPKLQESKTSGDPTGGLGLTGFVLRNINMPRFAGLLSQYQDRPVLDATGLGGTYDITLSVPEQLQASAEGKRGLMEWLSSSLFADIQRQLGLQLVTDKASVDYLVVDHVEMPSEN
jgi:uncharacterized protein (TIGR03435 family)